VSRSSRKSGSCSRYRYKYRSPDLVGIKGPCRQQVQHQHWQQHGW
jgi:hypothetical protein